MRRFRRFDFRFSVTGSLDRLCRVLHLTEDRHQEGAHPFGKCDRAVDIGLPAASHCCSCFVSACRIRIERLQSASALSWRDADCDGWLAVELATHSSGKTAMGRVARSLPLAAEYLAERVATIIAAVQ